MSREEGRKEATIWEHLEELALRLRRSVIIFLVATAIVSLVPANLVGSGSSSSDWFGFYKPLILELPIIVFKHMVPPTIQAFDGRTYTVYVIPARGFESVEVIAISAILLGFIASSPFIARELWLYIEPALYPHEKKFAKTYGFLFVASFIFGVAIAYFLIAPMIYRMLLKLYPLIVSEEYSLFLALRVSEVVSFVVKISIAMGLFFEAPVVIYLLLSRGIIDPDMFGENTIKYLFLGVMILAAIISPDPSGLGMLSIGLILYLPLYTAIVLGKKRARERLESRVSEA